MLRLAAVGLLLSGLLAGTASVAEDITDPDQARLIRQQQEKRQRLRQRIQELQADIDRVRGQKDKLTAELADRERELGRLYRGLRDLDRRLQRLKEDLASAREKHRQLRDAMRRDAQRLAMLLRSAYMAGRQERLKLFLNQQDPASLNRMLAYHDYISRERARQLERLRADLDELQRLAEDIAARQQVLQQTRLQQQEQRRLLETEQQERRRLLAQIEDSLSEKGRKLARWQEDERRLGELLEQIETALQGLDLPEQKGFRESRGSLSWPLGGRLLRRFGTEKIGNLRWDGVIISAKEGDLVRAVHAGRVAWADWLRGYGLLVIVEHGNGYMTLYGNNQSLFKETGDWVEAGEVIAQAGDGRMDGVSGVYFGIRHKGKALNPVRWCSRRR
ncbi:murein hydrolase activator EnvC family protein [Thiolapillus sp.]